MSKREISNSIKEEIEKIKEKETIGHDLKNLHIQASYV
jgi:hypothetical protein